MAEIFAQNVGSFSPFALSVACLTSLNQSKKNYTYHDEAHQTPVSTARTAPRVSFGNHLVLDAVMSISDLVDKYESLNLERKDPDERYD